MNNMYTEERFESMLQAARDSQQAHPQAIEKFFTFSHNYMLYSEERRKTLKTRLMAESAGAFDLQKELDEVQIELDQSCEELGAVSLAKEALESSLKRTETELAEAFQHNTVLQAKVAELENHSNTSSVINAKLEGKLTELNQKLEHALAQEEQISQQNNILLSQMSAMENTHSILNPIYWSKASWYSFGIGLVVGEQAIEQCTGHKPIRRFIARGTKKLFGKSNSQTTELSAESLKPAMTGIEEYGAYVEAVPSPVVPVIQVHG